jgi:phosphoenolpyruvate-protein kinase (PTS system EI component)
MTKKIAIAGAGSTSGTAIFGKSVKQPKPIINLFDNPEDHKPTILDRIDTDIVIMPNQEAYQIPDNRKSRRKQLKAAKQAVKKSHKAGLL